MIAELIGALVPLEMLSMWIEKRRLRVHEYEPIDYQGRWVLWGEVIETGERWIIVRLPFIHSWQRDYCRLNAYCWHTLELCRYGHDPRRSWPPAGWHMVWRRA